MLYRALAFASLLFAVSSCGVATPCELISNECDCYRAPGCRPVHDGCFCGAACDGSGVCICGGGKFLRCEVAR